MREYDQYRDNMQFIKEMFPGRVALSLDEACKVVGKCRNTVLNDKYFPLNKIGGSYAIPLVALAKYLCGERKVRKI